MNIGVVCYASVGGSGIVATELAKSLARRNHQVHLISTEPPFRLGEYEAGLEAAGFEDVSVEFTHEVADGMHGAIVKAVKTTRPEARGLPVIQPAASAGCC